MAVTLNPHLHRGFSVKRPICRFIGNYSHRFDIEVVLFPAGCSAHEKFERGISGLELVPLMFEALEVVDHLVDRWAVEINSELLCFDLNGGAASHF